MRPLWSFERRVTRRNSALPINLFGPSPGRKQPNDAELQALKARVESLERILAPAIWVALLLRALRRVRL